MSMIQFNNCKQDKHESLEDWVDRVLSLANKAFRELPEAYMNRQATLRFCQGCYDMDAGQHACVQKPQSMEAAIDTLKWYHPAGFSGVPQGFVHSHEIATVLLSVYINALSYRWYSKWLASINI
jgi:hypothetical protein